MPKLQDRLADKLGEHPAGAHLRGRKWGAIIASVIFSLFVLAIVGVWAAATEGYETVSRFSPNYNMTDNDHWFSKFIPGRTKGLCEPAFINPGDSFYTNNGIFLWEMGQGFNVSGNLIGNNNTQVNFNGTAEQYADNKLDNCDVSGLSIDMDLFEASITVQIYATCIDPKWPALLRSKNVYSIDDGRTVDPSYWFSGQIIVPERNDSTNLYVPINDLAADLWHRQRAIYLISSQVAPRVRGMRIVSDNNCALQPQDRRGCFDSPVTWQNRSQGFFLYPNLTVENYSYDNQSWWDVPINNFVQSVFAAARYDFGSNMTSNLFVNATARQALIAPIDPASTDNSSTLVNELSGAQSFLSSGVFMPPAVGKVRASYMCLVRQMKAPANFVVSVLGLTFALFGVVFAAAAFLAKHLFGWHIGGKPTTVVAPIAIAPVGADGGEGGHMDNEKINLDSPTDPTHQKLHSAQSSDDYKGRSPTDPRSTTPAPAYIGNGNGSEPRYAPLHDRSGSDAAGGPASGLSTPTPGGLKSRLSSFGSLSKFTDKLPSGLVAGALGAGLGAAGGAALGDKLPSNVNDLKSSFTNVSERLAASGAGTPLRSVTPVRGNSGIGGIPTIPSGAGGVSGPPSRVPSGPFPPDAVEVVSNKAAGLPNINIPGGGNLAGIPGQAQGFASNLPGQAQGFAGQAQGYAQQGLASHLPAGLQQHAGVIAGAGAAGIAAGAGLLASGAAKRVSASSHDADPAANAAPVSGVVGGPDQLWAGGEKVAEPADIGAGAPGAAPGAAPVAGAVAGSAPAPAPGSAPLAPGSAPAPDTLAPGSAAAQRYSGPQGVWNYAYDDSAPTSPTESEPLMSLGAGANRAVDPNAAAAPSAVDPAVAGVAGAGAAGAAGAASAPAATVPPAAPTAADSTPANVLSGSSFAAPDAAAAAPATSAPAAPAPASSGLPTGGLLAAGGAAAAGLGAAALAKAKTQAPSDQFIQPNAAAATGQVGSFGNVAQEKIGAAGAFASDKAGAIPGAGDKIAAGTAFAQEKVGAVGSLAQGQVGNASSLASDKVGAAGAFATDKTGAIPGVGDKVAEGTAFAQDKVGAVGTLASDKAGALPGAIPAVPGVSDKVAEGTAFAQDKVGAAGAFASDKAGVAGGQIGAATTTATDSVGAFGAAANEKIAAGVPAAPAQAGGIPKAALAAGAAGVAGLAGFAGSKIAAGDKAPAAGAEAPVAAPVEAAAAPAAAPAVEAPAPAAAPVAAPVEAPATAPVTAPATAPAAVPAAPVAEAPSTAATQASPPPSAQFVSSFPEAPKDIPTSSNIGSALPAAGAGAAAGLAGVGAARVAEARSAAPAAPAAAVDVAAANAPVHAKDVQLPSSPVSVKSIPAAVATTVSDADENVTVLPTTVLTKVPENAEELRAALAGKLPPGVEIPDDIQILPTTTVGALPKSAEEALASHPHALPSSATAIAEAGAAPEAASSSGGFLGTAQAKVAELHEKGKAQVDSLAGKLPGGIGAKVTDATAAGSAKLDGLVSNAGDQASWSNKPAPICFLLTRVL
ncbi:uncharacterized protein LOC62_07G009410 [Vanrija pseudolonga]|uniref:Uncharacterized protein n=1 Tax=Vanrija pseudolonga TaxID=143232 RepID=A0AAF0YIP0_9TREE|nr:hypothetical protein LOC62_07G009410 [Vanrija pseudolonga]